MRHTVATRSSTFISSLPIAALLLCCLAGHVACKGGRVGGSSSGGSTSGGARTTSYSSSALYSGPSQYRVYTTSGSGYTGSMAYRTFPTYPMVFGFVFLGGGYYGYGYHGYYARPYYTDNTMENCTMLFAKGANSTNTTNTTNTTAPPPSPSPPGSASPPIVRPTITYDVNGDPAGDLQFDTFFSENFLPNETFASFYEWNDTVYEVSNNTWWAGDCRVTQYGRGTELSAARLVAGLSTLFMGWLATWLLGALLSRG